MTWVGYTCPTYMTTQWPFTKRCIFSKCWLKIIFQKYSISIISSNGTKWGEGNSDTVFSFSHADLPCQRCYKNPNFNSGITEMNRVCFISSAKPSLTIHHLKQRSLWHEMRTAVSSLHSAQRKIKRWEEWIEEREEYRTSEQKAISPHTLQKGYLINMHHHTFTHTSHHSENMLFYKEKVPS